MAKIISADDIQSARPVGKPSKVVSPPKVRETYMDYRHDALMLHDDLAEKRAMLREQMQKDRAKKEANK